MLLFGHAGITLGAAVLLNGAVAKCYSLRIRLGTAKDCLEPCSKALPAQSQRFAGCASWLTSLGNRIDVRLLLIGSLLPDVIDKPVGLFFFRDLFGNVRIFSHTILFLLLVTLVGLYLYRSHGKNWLLVFSFGIFAHLIFEQMWHYPQTLLCPLYGLAFPQRELVHWVERLLHLLLTDPTIYIPEIIGAMILIWYIAVIVRKRNVSAFINDNQA